MVGEVGGSALYLDLRYVKLLGVMVNLSLINKLVWLAMKPILIYCATGRHLSEFSMASS